MVENILILILFGIAVWYISRLIYQSIIGEKKCASNCSGGCSKKFEIPID